MRDSLTSLRQKATFLAEAERLFLAQKAKIQHLNLSDKSSSFFHSIIKRNQRRSYIASIIRTDGMKTTSLAQIGEEFVSYFKGVFSMESNPQPIDPSIITSGNIITSELWPSLLATFSTQDIKTALFSIPDEKAPGPDGFSSGFFKKSWDIVGHDFCQAIQEFFRNGRLLRQLNHTTLALIPKSTNSTTPGEFRPIACCNTTYKVITKLISSRLEPIVCDLIDSAQSAFVGGRNIGDNIFLAQELIRHYNRKRISPRCMLKIDLRKAYDTISWSFLAQILRGLNFPPIFVDWIMECVTTPTFSIGLNGSLYGFFHAKRGLRQGDPMSPLLFILCIEYLSRMLNSRTGPGSDFNYHPKCDILNITHLAFADDLMLFCRGDRISIEILLNTLSEFHIKSGLEVNTAKSSIFTAGILQEDLQTILGTCGFQSGSLPVRYLGIPLASQKLNVVHYSPLVDRISSYISSWTANSLSYAGKVELIRSIVQGAECFWLQLFPLPQSVIQRITRLCRIFLWGHKKPAIAWEDLCFPKNEGGVGLRHLHTWNLALLAKTLWNIHTKSDTMWIKWIHNVYLKGQSVWVWRPRITDSPLLKSIANIRDRLLNLFGNQNACIEALSAIQSRENLKSRAFYDMLRPRGDIQPWKLTIWKGFTPPRYSFISWLAFKDRLPTRDRMTFLDIDRSCPFCTTVESTKHLFFECGFTQNIWTGIRVWLRLPHTQNTLFSAVKWIKKARIQDPALAKARLLALPCAIYLIWNTRNMAAFESNRRTPQDVIHLIKSKVYSVINTLFPRECINF